MLERAVLERASPAAEALGEEADPPACAARPCCRRPGEAALTELSAFFGLGGADAAARPLPLSALVGSAEDGNGEPLLLSLGSSRLSQLLLPARSPRPAVLGAGLPLFARVPPSCGWWPAAAPWRVCQEGAARLAAAAPRRRMLRLGSAAPALAALAARRTPTAELERLAASGSLVGLATCSIAGEREAGAVVVLLPAPAGASPLAVAGLLDARGLLLLAADAVLERLAERLRCGAG